MNKEDKYYENLEYSVLSIIFFSDFNNNIITIYLL